MKHKAKPSKGRTIILCAAIAVVIAALALTAAFAFNDSGQPLQLRQILPRAAAQRVKLTAHRGFSAVAPENSLPAIEAAAKAGFYAVEFDIHETLDGHWIVNHDSTVDAMTDGEGEIAEMTLAQLQALTVTGGANIEQYPGLRLASLEQVLDACQAGGIVPQIEIKAGSGAALARLLDALRERSMLGSAIIISFEHSILLELYALEPQVNYWFLCLELSEENLALAKQLPGARAAFPGTHMRGLLHVNRAKHIKAFREAGVELAVWTLDKPIHIWQYSAWGVEYITTNRIYR